MPRLSDRLLRPKGIAPLAVVSLVFWAAGATAQNQPYFSPTFAASVKGSPYSDVYARTFGGGAPAPAPAPEATGNPAPGGVVYVIEGGGLLTYRAEDYAKGSGEAVARAPLPPTDFARGISAPEVRLPSIADKFYAAPPLETAAGPIAGPAPIPLYPPPN